MKEKNIIEEIERLEKNKAEMEKAVINQRNFFHEYVEKIFSDLFSIPMIIDLFKKNYTSLDSDGYEVTFKSNTHPYITITDNDISVRWYASSINQMPYKGIEEVDEESLTYLINCGIIAKKLKNEDVRNSIHLAYVEIENYYVANIKPLDDLLSTYETELRKERVNLREMEDEEIKEQIMENLYAGKTWIANNKLPFSFLYINKKINWKLFTLIKENKKTFEISNNVGDIRRVNKEDILSQLIRYHREPVYYKSKNNYDGTYSYYKTLQYIWVYPEEEYDSDVFEYEEVSEEEYNKHEGIK